MAFLSFNDVAVKAIAACVPANISKNADLIKFMSQAEVDKVVQNIGIHEKRFVDAGTTPADLCLQAAEHLLQTLQVDRNEIDVLIFMSQSPDHRIPATSPWLQNKLNLPNTTACFDVSLACSGYIYSLCTAFAYAQQPRIRKVLLLDGEAFTRIVNPLDHVNGPLYGDAGTATLIEKVSGAESHFNLFTDGSGQDAIKVPSGGARQPFAMDSLIEIDHPDGSKRSNCQLYMDGVEVFNFTLKVVPKLVKETLELAGMTMEQMDAVVFHQANKFMIDFFAKKLKIPSHKIPISLNRFGNVSSATIPLTIASEFCNLEKRVDQVLLAGFGAGLSWAGAVLSLEHCVSLPIIEFK